MKTPKRHYAPKLTLYPMKFEDAVKTLAKVRAAPKKLKKSHSRHP